MVRISNSRDERCLSEKYTLILFDLIAYHNLDLHERSVLVDVWFCASCSRDNLLDEFGYFSHYVDTV